MNFDNAHVLITGANRGLGKALVTELLQQNVTRIYAGARRPETIVITDPRVIPVALDVTKPESIQALARNIGQLDLLINNAGVVEFNNILTTSEAELDHCFNVNLKGLWRVSRAFIPHLEESDKGALCNILSILSLVSSPAIAAYNISKAAAWSATLSLRATLQARGIEVHAVFPAGIDTDMTAQMEIDKDSPAKIAHDIIMGIIAGDEDIFPSVATHIYSAWREDHKNLERQFGLG